MTDCASRLTSYEPIVEMLWRFECRADGWVIWSRHRHYSGLFTDCEPFELCQLSEPEMHDVVFTLINEFAARTSIVAEQWLD